MTEMNNRGNSMGGRGRGRGRAQCFNCKDFGHMANACPNRDKICVWMTVEQKQKWDKLIAEDVRAQEVKQQERFVEALKLALKENNSKSEKKKKKIDEDSDSEEDVLSSSDEKILRRKKSKKILARGRSKSRSKEKRSSRSISKSNKIKNDSEDSDGGEVSQITPPKRKREDLDRLVSRVNDEIKSWEYDKGHAANWRFIKDKIKKMIGDEEVYNMVIEKIAKDNKVEQGNDKSMDVAVCRYLLKNVA